jgi:hypothetical protein
MKMAVFWVVALGSLAKGYQRSRSIFCVHHDITLIMEATRINETLADFSHTVLQHRRE